MSSSSMLTFRLQDRDDRCDPPDMPILEVSVVDNELFLNICGPGHSSVRRVHGITVNARTFLRMLRFAMAHDLEESAEDTKAVRDD